jgi:hypothetical protein
LNSVSLNDLHCVYNINLFLKQILFSFIDYKYHFKEKLIIGIGKIESCIFKFQSLLKNFRDGISKSNKINNKNKKI